MRLVFQDGDDNVRTQKEDVVLAATVIRYTITGVLFPIFDIGSDLAAAFTHFKVRSTTSGWEKDTCSTSTSESLLQFHDISWGILTLFFVWLPGFTAASGVAISGLWKKFSKRRLINYAIVLLIMPFIYPFAVVLL